MKSNFVANKTHRLFQVVATAAILSTAGYANAQDVNPDTVLKKPKIYSPYVERTVSNSNLAEGVYWTEPMHMQSALVIVRQHQPGSMT